MELNEYRTRVIERLRGCRDTSAARAVLAEVDLMLQSSRLTAITRDRFWETLQEDLRAIREDTKHLTDRKAAAAFDAVLAVAEARIARYRDHTAEPDT